MTTPAPDTATVRGRYCDGTYLQTGHTTDGADFDRWLAEHDREAATGRDSRQVDLNREDHRIADALERAHPAKFHPGGLVQPPRNVAVEPVPNQPGVFREVTHAAWDDCERPSDPLDESDHRPRHDRYSQHWERSGNWWVATQWHADGSWVLAELDRFHGPLTFCDCDDDAIIEAENGATD